MLGPNIFLGKPILANDIEFRFISSDACVTCELVRNFFEHADENLLRV